MRCPEHAPEGRGQCWRDAGHEGGHAVKQETRADVLALDVDMINRALADFPRLVAERYAKRPSPNRAQRRQMLKSPKKGKRK